jgi:hypothetical protein
MDDWKRRPVRDVRVGDSIEDPRNEACWGVTLIEPVRPGSSWYRLRAGGLTYDMVPGDQEFWVLRSLEEA